MPERIYISSSNGRLEPLEETLFSSEDELQALLAEHPELLDGEQICPRDARRWLLVTREKGIAPSQGEAVRWSVDHLLIDQDAVPTLAEVKLGSNSEIRRSIVGQLLEYAAHASETWTPEELRGALLAQGRDAQEEIATLLRTEDEADVDAFWKDVSTNLAAKRLRLLFVADRIPDPLARVVEFLNGQMPNIEVLAVEIKRFQGPAGRTLVPRVIGRTSAVPSRSGSRQRLTRESFLEGFSDGDVRAVAVRLLDTARQPGVDINYGTSYAVRIDVRCSAWARPIRVAWLHSQPGRRGWRRTKDFSFGARTFEDNLPEELQSVLQRWEEQFSADGFVEDVSSMEARAWAVSHKDAVLHQDLLAERLGRVISQLTSLDTAAAV